MDSEQVAAIANQFQEGGAILLMLIDHPRIKTLSKAIFAKGCLTICHEIFSVEVLTGSGAELAMLEDMGKESTENKLAT